MVCDKRQDKKCVVRCPSQQKLGLLWQRFVACHTSQYDWVDNWAEQPGRYRSIQGLTHPGLLDFPVFGVYKWGAPYSVPDSKLGLLWQVLYILLQPSPGDNRRRPPVAASVQALIESHPVVQQYLVSLPHLCGHLCLALHSTVHCMVRCDLQCVLQAHKAL